MTQELTKEQVFETFYNVFPNCLITAQKACFGDSLYYTVTLGNNDKEFPHGYRDNDPLSYRFEIDGNTYRELCVYVFLKPEDTFHVYSSKSLRKQTIKSLTLEKLEKRFKKVKEFLVENKESFHTDRLQFNIEGKI